MYKISLNDLISMGKSNTAKSNLMPNVNKCSTLETNRGIINSMITSSYSSQRNLGLRPKKKGPRYALDKNRKLRKSRKKKRKKNITSLNDKSINSGLRVTSSDANHEKEPHKKKRKISLSQFSTKKEAGINSHNSKNPEVKVKLEKKSKMPVIVKNKLSNKPISKKMKYQNKSLENNSVSNEIKEVKREKGIVDISNSNKGDSSKVSIKKNTLDKSQSLESNNQQMFVKRKAPTKEIADRMTTEVVNDITNYVSASEKSSSPIINVNHAFKNLRTNILECLKSEVNIDESGPNEKDDNYVRVIREVIKKNATETNNIIEKVIVDVIKNVDFSTVLDPNFRRNLYMPNISIMESVYKNNSDINGDLKKNNYCNVSLQALDIRYISTQLREVNPESEHEKYCINSYLKRKSVGTIDNEVNNNMRSNKCYAKNTYGVDLKSFVLPLEKERSAKRRQCMVCYTKMLTDIVLANDFSRIHTINLLQSYTVLFGQIGGYYENFTLSQGSIPSLLGPMKVHNKTHYVVNNRKMKTKSGKWLKGLSEISSIHFRE